jgi:membrane protease YdiL (CAAX protease family)
MPHPSRAGTWPFFALAFAWSWSFWIAAALAGASVAAASGRALLLLGLAGPALAGIALVCREGAEARRDYWRRLVEPGRVPARWWPVILLLVPALLAAATLLALATGDAAPARLGGRLAALAAAPAAVVPFLLGVLLQGPLPEELGWRGYALDRLQARRSALAASLVLGALWALWHLPLFFMPGMLHAERGAFTAWFWLFMAQTLAAAILYTWIHNNTRRSTLAAIAFHFAANLAYELAGPGEAANAYAALLWIAAALGVVALWGPRRLTRGGFIASGAAGAPR